MRHTHTMPRRRNVAAFLVGLGVWLAVLLLAFAAILHFTDPISAQQTSTTAALPAPTLTAAPGENGVNLSRTAVTGAVRYELWTWTNTDGWQQLGGDA